MNQKNKNPEEYKFGIFTWKYANDSNWLLLYTHLPAWFPSNMEDNAYVWNHVSQPSHHMSKSKLPIEASYSSRVCEQPVFDS